MRRVLLVLVLSGLFVHPVVVADDDRGGDDARRRARLIESKSGYELLLRDARTETAARYFVERILRIEAELGVHGAADAPTEAPAEAPGAILMQVDRWLRARIRAEVAKRDASLSGVAAWTRRELPELLFASEAFEAAQDAGGSATDARRAWESRTRRGWRPAPYGSGTFIVRPAHRRPLTDAERTRLDEGEARIATPKPPTRDQWWARASPEERADWVLAFFVEQSGLFERAEHEQLHACPRCAGAGIESKALANGTRVQYLCTRCAGVRHDVTIRYR